MPKLSIVVIALNEERNLPRLFAAVQGLWDELLVVDSFSTDHTPAISRAAGARVVQRPFEGHVEQKSFALAEARYHHVLSLDADEAPDARLYQSIARTKTDWAADGFTMNRLSRYCGHWVHHSGWYPDRKLRLVDRRKARWGGDNPHYKLLPARDATIHHLEGDLLHYTFDSVEAHLRQINFFSSIKAQVAFKRGKSHALPKMLFSSGFTFFRHFVLKQGFRDGYVGFLIAAFSAFSTLAKYAKLRELHKPAQHQTTREDGVPQENSPSI